MPFKAKHLTFIAMASLFISTAGCRKNNITATTKAGPSGYKIYGNTGTDVLRSFSPTADGGFVFGGYTDTTANSNAFIQKCDANGNVSWYRTFGGDHWDMFNVVRQTSDGGFIAAGATSSQGLGAQTTNHYSDAWLVKTDAQGNLLWQKTFGDVYPDRFYDVQETPDHGFVTTGDIGTRGDILNIIKTNREGDSLWGQKIFIYDYNLAGTSLAIAPNGNIAIAGISESHNPLFVLYPSFTLLSSNGSILISQKLFTQFGSLPLYVGSDLFRFGYLNFEKIIARPDGFIMVISVDEINDLVWNAQKKDLSKKVIAFKTDFNGNVLWSQNYTGIGNGIVFNDVTKNQAGGVLISGGSLDSTGSYYNWLLNTDASGNKTYEHFIPVANASSWVAGAAQIGQNYVIGINTQPRDKSRRHYFGFLKTDLNGKIVE